MFHVGRFDPRQEDLKKRKLTEGPTRKEIKEKKSKKAKRTKNDNPKGRQKEVDNNESTDKDAAIPTVTSSVDESPALKVIAPETSGPSTIQKNLHTKLTVEAFDDLDLVDDSILEVDDKKGANEEQEDKVPAIFDPHDEVQTALFMSRQPIQEAAAGWGLAPFLIQNLLQDGYHHFFPIQALVIPDVITTERHAHLQARDVCVAAPTGSGKTLSFVLPVLNALAKRQIRRLRALVVLPSRDLGTAFAALGRFLYHGYACIAKN
jgi:ATP-dependent RNA helicase DDX51/DBP6